MTKSRLTDPERLFWNEEQMVAYFASKEPDFRIRRRLSCVSSPSNKRALDLGCGGGRHTELLCKMSFRIYASDLSAAMVETTKNRMRRYVGGQELDKNIVQASMQKLPFSDRSFDVVVATGVLHQAKNYFDYYRALKELGRVCKKGCVVCLNVFTDKVWDDTYTKKGKYTVITKEGLVMTLLPKNKFISAMRRHGFALEEDLGVDIKLENTGPRAVFRANFAKTL